MWNVKCDIRLNFWIVIAKHCEILQNVDKIWWIDIN